jgi:hypothetical protein
LLDKFDIVLPEPYFFKSTARAEYAKAHYSKDMDTLRELVQQISPEYVTAFDKVLSQNYLSLCNMFIARREIFDRYMEWVMPILEESYREIDTSTYSTYDKRLAGYFAEWLFNVWLEKQVGLKKCYEPVAKLDDPRGIATLKTVWKFLRYPFWKVMGRIR